MMTTIKLARHSPAPTATPVAAMTQIEAAVVSPSTV